MTNSEASEKSESKNSCWRSEIVEQSLRLGATQQVEHLFQIGTICFVNPEERPLRADAERNRQAIICAAGRVFAEHGPETTLRASQSLWVHMRCVRPDWPSEAERAEDIAHHVELKRRLDQAGRGLGSR